MELFSYKSRKNTHVYVVKKQKRAKPRGTTVRQQKNTNGQEQWHTITALGTTRPTEDAPWAEALTVVATVAPGEELRLATVSGGGSAALLRVPVRP